MTLSEDHDDGSANFARLPNELKLMFADQLGIHDVNALARTCREMNELLTRIMYLRAKDSRAKGNRPYFLLAVDDGNLPAVERFVEVGAEANMTQTDRVELPQTAIHSCAHYGHVEIAEFLIARGIIDLSAVDRLGRGALLIALMGVRPNEAMVTLLVEAGVDVKAPWHYRTPLHMAAMNGDDRIVQRLLDLGADPNAADWDGTRPVHKAAAYSNAATVRCLLEAGKNVEIADNDGRTPLHKAVQYGMADSVKLLLEMGADVSSADWQGWTPLHAAVYFHGSGATVHRILHVNASTSRKTYKCDSRCLFDQTNHGIIELLLAAGADVAKTDNYGKSPLSWATARQREYSMRPEYPTYE